MNFGLVTEANEIIFRHGKLLKDFNTGDILKHHFRYISSEQQLFCSINDLKTQNLASITAYKVHWDSFQMFSNKNDSHTTKTQLIINLLCQHR